MTVRALTPGEIALAQSVYGTNINYTIVRIHDYAHPLILNRISAPNGEIYYGGTGNQADFYTSDFSLSDRLEVRGSFIHEMAHVYQQQQDGDLYFRGSFDYDFTDKLLRNVPYGRWTIEEQAAFMEEVYYRTQGNRGYHPELPNEFLETVDTGGLAKIPLPSSPHCFPANTPIQTSLTTTTPISELTIGDTVLAFDPSADMGRGALVPRRVTQLFRNVTTEWLQISWQENGARHELISTPNHHFLDEHGQFATIAELLIRGGGAARIVVATGDVVEAKAVRINYSADTAHLFERAQNISVGHGNLALKPQMLDGWQSYNFEVEELHTYVAGGVRVHNDSRVIIDTAGSIGQFFGTRLGLALTEGENQFVQLAAGTVLGVAGQTLARVITDVGIYQINVANDNLAHKLAA